MRSRRLFLDAGPLVAAAVSSDLHHARGLAILRAIGSGQWSSAVTSDYVVTEACNFLRMKAKRREAVEGLMAILFGTAHAPPAVSTILRIHGGRFASALERFRDDFERGLSLTDWTTIVAMQEAGITDLATFDRGFHGLVDVMGLK